MSIDVHTSSDYSTSLEEQALESISRECDQAILSATADLLQHHEYDYDEESNDNDTQPDKITGEDDHPSSSAASTLSTQYRTSYQLSIDMLSQFSLDDIRKRFHLNSEDAAKSLGVSRTTLQKHCRLYNIKRWPCRQLQDISNTIRLLEMMYVDSPSAMSRKNDDQNPIRSKHHVYQQLQAMKLMRQKLIEDPSQPVDYSSIVADISQYQLELFVSGDKDNDEIVSDVDPEDIDEMIMVVPEPTPIALGLTTVEENIELVITAIDNDHVDGIQSHDDHQHEFRRKRTRFQGPIALAPLRIHKRSSLSKPIIHLREPDIHGEYQVELVPGLSIFPPTSFQSLVIMTGHIDTSSSSDNQHHPTSSCDQTMSSLEVHADLHPSTSTSSSDDSSHSVHVDHPQGISNNVSDHHDTMHHAVNHRYDGPILTANLIPSDPCATHTILPHSRGQSHHQADM